MVYKIGPPNGCVYMGLLLLVALRNYQFLKNLSGINTGGLKHCQSKPTKNALNTLEKNSK